MAFARTVAKLALSSVTATVLSFLAITIFAREVGPAALGTFFLFESIVAATVTLGDGGVSISVEKRISSGENPNQIIGGAISVKLLLSGAFAVAVWLARPILTEFLGLSAAGLLILAFVFGQFRRDFESVIRGSHRVRETAVFKILQQGSWLAFGLLLLEFSYSAGGLILAFVVSQGLVVALALYRLDVRPSIPDGDSLRSLTGYAKWAYIGSLGGVVYNWMDVLLIGFFLTNSAVGIYEVAWRLATVTLVVSMAVRRAAFPLINAEGGCHSTDRIEELMYEFFTPSMILVLPALTGAIVIGNDILRFVFGPEYVVAGVVLIILMVEKVQEAFAYVLIAPMHALDRPDLAAKSTAAGIVTNFVLNLLLIPVFGITGAAVATLVGETVNFGVHGWYLNKFINIQIPQRELGVCTLAAILMGTVIFWVAELTDIRSIFELIAIISFGALVYFGLISLSPRIRKRAISTLEAVRIGA